MLMPVLKSIAEERADLCRNVEYMRELALDEYLKARSLELEAHFHPTNEAAEEKDVRETNAQIVCESDETRDIEIQRILNSEKDLSFNEMIGIVD